VKRFHADRQQRAVLTLHRVPPWRPARAQQSRSFCCCRWAAPIASRVRPRSRRCPRRVPSTFCL